MNPPESEPIPAPRKGRRLTPYQPAPAAVKDVSTVAQTPPANATERTSGGRFRPGCSGNPCGRPRSDSATLRQQLVERAEDVLETVMGAALSGDMTAAKMILDRILPPLRPYSESVHIPLDPRASPAATAGAILDAAVAGRISPDAAVQLLSAAASLSRIIETEELKVRLEALERAVTPPKPSPHKRA